MVTELSPLQYSVVVGFGGGSAGEELSFLGFQRWVLRDAFSGFQRWDRGLD